MGQAQSSNFSNTIIDTYTKVVQDTNSTALQSSLNQAKIEISGGQGDVNISNASIKQMVQNDMTASFESVNESSVLQKVSQSISQQASSMISGLNLGNFSESENSINTAISASMDVSQTISTSCTSVAVNQVEIAIKNQVGTINIDNLNIDNTIKSAMTCATKSLNKSIASQDIENKIAQKATAESKGLSLDFMGGIVAVAIVLMIGFSVVIRQMGLIIPPLVVGASETVIAKKQLLPLNKDIETITKTMKKNEEIFKEPKPLKQLREYYYTCGLYGIDTYTRCFSSSSNTTAPPPKQNVAGCTFEEVPVSMTFSNPDQAYNYWLDQPELSAIDIISKDNGAYYQYHFYKNVSKQCIRLMDSLVKDPKYVKIPPLICDMKDPVESSNVLPTLSPDAAPTFLFTLDGYLYYTENNTWIKYNADSLFKAKSKDNIKISITSLEDQETITIPNTIVNDYFFIDMSKARKNTLETEEPTEYYYKIYKYSLGDKTRAPNVKLQLIPSDFTEIAKLDVTDMVKSKKIGPFMTNPKVLTSRNLTVIWDPDINIKQVQNENQETLDKLTQDKKQCVASMIAIGSIGFLIMLVSGVSLLFRKKETTQNMNTQLFHKKK